MRSEIARLRRGALLLIGGTLFWWVGRMPVIAQGSAGESPAPAGEAAPSGTSIAVLPFVNMSADAARAAGLADLETWRTRRVWRGAASTGSFCDDWAGFRNVQAASGRAPRTEPFSA